MSLTWAGPVGYQWGWSWMTKCTWLTKPWNFELVLSNLLGRLIHGSFGCGCVVDMHPKKVEAWLVCKWVIYSQSVWFSYLIFLRITRTSFVNVDMILKQDDNKNIIVKIGLMVVCSNYHGHENNQIYKKIKTKMRTKVGLFSNWNHEIT